MPRRAPHDARPRSPPLCSPPAWSRGSAGSRVTSSAQAAADETPGYSLHHITVNTKVGPNSDKACAVDADLYIPDGASRTQPQALDPHHQRLRRPQGRRQRGGGGPRVREAGLRRARLHRAGLRQLQLQDHPRRPGVRRQGRPPDGGRAGGDAHLRRGRHLQDAAAGVAGAARRPARRHDRRLLRRPDPVRRRHAGQARRRDRPDHHLERPVLLARPEQHELRAWRDLPRPVASRRRSGSTCSSAPASPTACRAGTSTQRTSCPPCPDFTDQACVGAVELELAGLPERRHARSSRGMRPSRRT